MSNASLIADQPYLGDVSKAWETYQNTYKKSSGYREFIAAEMGKGKTPQDFFEVPITNKSNYVKPYSLKSRMAVEWNEVLALARSSGFSAKEPTYWPILKAKDTNKSPQFIATIFQLQQKSTLHIVALSLGSWAGGEELAFRTKRLLSEMPIPSVVCTPGNDYADCIDTISRFKGEFDQIIMYIVPSAIIELMIFAREQGVELPWKQLIFVICGESISEAMRTHLYQRGLSIGKVLSLYGSSETPPMGFESPGLAALRQLLYLQPACAASFNYREGEIPLFHHILLDDLFIESNEKGSLITRWQAAPLIRYNLGDRVQLFPWTKFRAAALSLKSQIKDNRYLPLLDVIEKTPEQLPDIIALHGRADDMLMLAGSNITQEAINSAIIGAPSLQEKITGKYRASVVLGKEDKQQLQIIIELKPDVNEISKADYQKIYHELIERLGTAQPEFKQDYEQRYRRYDSTDYAILTLQFKPWPYFKPGKTIKHRYLDK